MKYAQLDYEKKAPLAGMQTTKTVNHKFMMYDAVWNEDRIKKKKRRYNILETNIYFCMEPICLSYGIIL